jgi:cytochrome c553
MIIAFDQSPKPKNTMKQVVTRLEDKEHAALSAKAKANRRTMGQQLVAMAFQNSKPSKQKASK